MADMKNTSFLSADDNAKLHNIVRKTDPALAEKFERAFSNWKAKWFTGEAAFSSNTKDNKKAPEYTVLKEMGSCIIPLVVKKMVDTDNFIALVLYDDLIDETSLKIQYRGIEDPHFLEGEAARAIRTAKLWLKAR